MKIILYQNYAEQELLDKRSSAIIMAELDGAFRNEVNLTSPTIGIETTIDIINKCNYLSIPILNRYYYIVDKTIVRSNGNILACDLSLEEDVITTYINEINNLKVITSRQEFDYNDLLVDEKLPATTNSKINFFKPNNKHFTKTGSECCYILNTTAPPVTPVDPTTVSPQNPLNVYSNSYILTQDQLEVFTRAVLGDQASIADKIGFLFNDPSEALVSCVYVPFDILTDTTGLTTKTVGGVIIGKGSITCPCREVTNGYIIKYIPCEPFYIPHPHTLRNFLNYSPYTSIEIFLPFYGFLTVDTNVVLNANIQIEYHIDVISGAAKIILRDYLTYDILYTVPCILGATIDLSTSNVAEKTRNMAQYTVNTFANVISLASGTAIGRMSAPKKYTPVKKKITKKYATWEKKTNLENTERYANFVSKNTCDLMDALQNHISSGISAPSVTEWSVFTNEDNNEYGFNIFVKITTVNDVDINDYAKLIGRPSVANDYIKNFTGYTEVSSVHLDTFNSATIDELDEIDIILRSGVIINHPILANNPIVVDNLGNPVNYILINYNTMNANKNITINGVTQYIDYSKNILSIKIKLSYFAYINYNISDSNFDITNLYGGFHDTGAAFYLEFTCNIKPKIGLSPTSFTPTITLIKN